MVKTMYVPNTIRIPTHGVDLSHHGIGFGGRSKNRQWSRNKVEREQRNKESEEGERERDGAPYSVHSVTPIELV
jgi:hypothetical protein